MRVINEKYDSLHSLCWWENGHEFLNRTGSKTVFSPSKLYLVYFHMDMASIQKDLGVMSFYMAKCKIFAMKLKYKLGLV